MNQESIENEFNQMRAAARTTSVNILAIRMALVDKGLCTEEELQNYDAQANETIDNLMNLEIEKMIEAVRNQHGDEAAEKMIEELSNVFNAKE